MNKKLLKLLNGIAIILGFAAIGILVYAILKQIFHF